MKWEIGRSANPKAPYFKFKVFISKLFKMDCYILKYPEGSSINYHKDPAPKDYKHYRLNIVLKHAKVGGEFLSFKNIGIGWFEAKHCKRFNLFRPDIVDHAVAEIESGTRYVLSFGWLIKE